VTGGSEGIGRGIAHVFAKEGATVFVLARREEKGQQSVEELRKETENKQIFFLRCDVSRGEDLESATKEIISRYGRIDILCHNAGIFPDVRIENATAELYSRVLGTNVVGTFLAVKAVLPQMKEQKYGRIVLTSSITGPRTGIPGLAHYGASKAAQEGWMRSAAIELAKYNITVNCVEPGNILTEGLARIGPEYAEKQKSRIPMGRLGNVFDIGYAFLYLASDEASFVTGATLVVDGGQTLPEGTDIS